MDPAKETHNVNRGSRLVIRQTVIFLCHQTKCLEQREKEKMHQQPQHLPLKHILHWRHQAHPTLSIPKGPMLWRLKPFPSPGSGGCEGPIVAAESVFKRVGNSSSSTAALSAGAAIHTVRAEDVLTTARGNPALLTPHRSTELKSSSHGIRRHQTGLRDSVRVDET